MSKNPNILALRRESIRALSPDEMRAAHGGAGRTGTNTGNGCTGTTGNGTGNGTGTKN